MKELYRETEREKAIKLIKNTALFSNAKGGRILKYKGKDYTKDEILMDGINNVYETIRDDVLNYFKKNKISFWHVKGTSEPTDQPTGHTLSSQICCVNHLFPIRNDEKEVLKIAKMFCPDIKEVLKIPTDKYEEAFIQFEAVSDTDHLNERNTTRGSVCTSIDALIYGILENGKKIILPIEWKYTEQYEREDKSIEDRKSEPKGNESRGKERLRRYTGLIEKSKYLKKLKEYRSSIYFFEPMYQLMRQTLWAEQMIQNKKTETIKADDYVHIHIIPKENLPLLFEDIKIKDRGLEQTWKDCLLKKDKYRIIEPKAIIECLDNNKYNNLINYLTKRYWREYKKELEQ